MSGFLHRLRQRALSEFNVAVSSAARDLRDEVAVLRSEHEDRLAALEARLAPASVPIELPLDRFRGSRELISERQQQYVSLFRGARDVIDLGCGRGEFLRLLGEAGIPALGVDRDPALVRQCQRDGLQVVEGDAVAYLGECAPGSLDGIFSAQLIEHLELGDVARLIAIARTRLRPGGVLLLETVNPLCFTGLANFWLDPGHRRPIHPELMRWLAEQHGYGDIAVITSLASEDHAVPPLAGVPDAESLARFNAGIARVNDLLFGPQAYALVAHRPA